MFRAVIGDSSVGTRDGDRALIDDHVHIARKLIQTGCSGSQFVICSGGDIFHGIVADGPCPAHICHRTLTDLFAVGCGDRDHDIAHGVAVSDRFRSDHHARQTDAEGIGGGIGAFQIEHTAARGAVAVHIHIGE